MTGLVKLTRAGGCGGGGGGNGEGDKRANKSSEEEQNQVSLVALLLVAVRSMVACHVERREEVISAVHNMDIGWPTNVQHLTYVTFDRFNGFLGLPVEFEVENPGGVPSASASMFGVSAESMQLSFDSKGNSVPTILLLMRERLYSQEGLKELVRSQLNRGIVPDDINVHCLAGLIKAWFRELPSGILDGLSPEEVLQCNTEEESVELVKQLKPTEAALLNWAINLMADVVEEELNKMNARNIAMVFSPNMTQKDQHQTMKKVHTPSTAAKMKMKSECLLRHLGENKTAGNSLVLADQPTGELHGEYLSPQSCLSFNMDSGTSFCDGKNGNSAFSTTSDGEVPSGKCMGAEETSVHMEIP
ncbi:rho GTPase-activating protein 2-like [Pyrus ussuriensis x Pyrus communis]|uniref:Rho GTPase-activating protein 2-like n=1 Tax=Pyrus ussuriensis x Pyrus communis TaxID=2448454 RepID=A0A5N5GKV9_9ROSA|nr:rho GTPase-activating protein 2-like [Pyrus ussuriensis x Pyrus communis]